MRHADGELTPRIDGDLADRLRALADARGRAVEVYAVEQLASLIEDRWGWEDDERRYQEFQRTGEGVPAEEALAEFRTSVLSRLDHKA